MEILETKVVRGLDLEIHTTFRHEGVERTIQCQWEPEGGWRLDVYVAGWWCGYATSVTDSRLLEARLADHLPASAARSLAAAVWTEVEKRRPRCSAEEAYFGI